MHIFRFWQGGSFTIGGRRSSEDDALDLSIARGHQNVEGAIDIDAIGFDGIFHGERHGGTRGQMDYVIGFIDGATDDLDVGDAALDEGDFVADFGEIFFFAAGKVIEDHHAMAAAHQFVHGI